MATRSQVEDDLEQIFGMFKDFTVGRVKRYSLGDNLAYLWQGYISQRNYSTHQHYDYNYDYDYDALVNDFICTGCYGRLLFWTIFVYLRRMMQMWCDFKVARNNKLFTS